MLKNNRLKREKQQVAEAALAHVPVDGVLGVGTGSTVNYFIEAFSKIKHQVKHVVASSEATREALAAHGINAVSLNHVSSVDVYVDGADEFNPYLSLIKGGGGALTQEKIIAAASEQFVCIVDSSKQSSYLGKVPVAIEVISMARSYVARQLVKMGGFPEYREGVLTDNGHDILDVYQLDLSEPMAMERRLNDIPGVVANGLFALRGADIVLMAGQEIQQFKPQSR